MIYTEVEIGATCDTPGCGGEIRIMRPFSADEPVEWGDAEMTIELCGWIISGETTTCSLCAARIRAEGA